MHIFLDRLENYNKILVIQTAFIGDVILATSLLHTLHLNHPQAQLDIVVRKGNESLFFEHPYINKVYVWDKSNGKINNLLRILKEIRKIKYCLVIGVQRFFNAGVLTAFSKGKTTVGFNKNPLSWKFNHKVKHEIGTGLHEVDRNHLLVKNSCKTLHRQLKLYPSEKNFSKIKEYSNSPFIVIAPASVWFTKQFPKEKWIDFLNSIPEEKVYIIGAPSDTELAKEIIQSTAHSNVYSLCGKLNLLDSAALMSKAKMNYVNDSAPQHLASSVNAPTTALFCSTTESFGFGPLSDNAIVIETKLSLDCKPCGLHGHKACPKQHFKCGHSIQNQDLIDRVNG